MKTLLFLFPVLLFCVGCKKINEDYNLQRIKDAELIKELNTKAVDTLNIGSLKLVLSSWLDRNFMPVSPDDGMPLRSVVSLINIDSTDIPENINLFTQYVLYNDSIWVGDFYPVNFPVPSYKITKTTIDGPKWGPKVYVTVIAKVHDYTYGKDYYLREKDVYINRSD